MGADELADELYAVAPADFIARRHEHVRALRAAGDRRLAAEVASWRKPVVAAWAVNLLVRDAEPQIEELVALGEELAAARDADAIRGIAQRRQRLVRELVARAEELAAQAGAPIGGSTGYEIEATLNAAVADPAVAERVLSGRLVKPESYAGFGPLGGVGERPALRVVPDAPAGPSIRRRSAPAEAPAPEAPGRKALGPEAPGREGPGPKTVAGKGSKAAPPKAAPPKAGGRASTASAGKTLPEAPVAKTATQRRAEERRAAERARAEQAAERARAALADAERRQRTALAALEEAEEAWRALDEQAAELKAQLGAVERRLTEAELDRRRLGHAADRATAAVEQALARSESAERNVARHR